MKELKMKYWNEHSGGDMILLEIIRTKVGSFFNSCRQLREYSWSWTEQLGIIYLSLSEWILTRIAAVINVSE